MNGNSSAIAQFTGIVEIGYLARCYRQPVYAEIRCADKMDINYVNLLLLKTRTKVLGTTFANGKKSYHSIERSTNIINIIFERKKNKSRVFLKIENIVHFHRRSKEKATFFFLFYFQIWTQWSQQRAD